MTVLEVLTAASGYLAKHGVESPRLNAEHLLAHALGKKRLDLYMEFDRPLSDQERAPLREWTRQRGNGIPLQHLLGTAEFFGRSFLCDARALIPRPETERLIELIKDSAPTLPANPLVLDIGTGSGVIALTLALEIAESTVTATDLSEKALALAGENATRLAVSDRVSFVHTDLFPESGGPFHLIAANLPYIPSGEIPDLQREVQHDPVAALDGGPDGLALIRKLITAARARAVPGALIALEIGHDQAARVAALFAENQFSNIQTHRDYENRERFVFASA
ncbi:peptide chain release factor N(5)-glutamine methyltransferase [soil metagenome]